MKRQAGLGAVVLSVAFLVSLAGAAHADDAREQLQKIAAAQASATSWVMHVGLGPATATTTVVHHAGSGYAVKTEIGTPSFTISDYLVDSVMYVSLDGTSWQKKTLDPAQLKGRLSGYLIAGFADPSTSATLQPDRTDGGVAYGAIRVVVSSSALALPPGAALQKLALECMYDKHTLLLHECDSDIVNITYTGYNDPVNAVLLPAAASHATPLTLPMAGDPPAPASSPDAR